MSPAPLHLSRRRLPRPEPHRKCGLLYPLHSPKPHLTPPDLPFLDASRRGYAGLCAEKEAIGPGKLIAVCRNRAKHGVTRGTMLVERAFVQTVIELSRPASGNYA